MRRWCVEKEGCCQGHTPYPRTMPLRALKLKSIFRFVPKQLCNVHGLFARSKALLDFFFLVTRPNRFLPSEMKVVHPIVLKFCSPFQFNFRVQASTPR